MLFAKGGRRGSGFDSKTKQNTGTKFEMLVEDITEGVLVSLDKVFLLFNNGISLLYNNISFIITLVATSPLLFYDLELILSLTKEHFYSNSCFYAKLCACLV